MTESDYPKFLSKIAKGEDKFEGGSQDNLAKVISEVIKEDKIEKKVIGLEGEWGSGKSNLIKIIQSELGSNYHTFIFDSWGSQEDLTRKSFLEQLINELFLNEFLIEKEKWKDLKNRLLSNTSTTHTQKYPQIKPYWLIISLAILLFTILSSSYENILIDYDIWKSVNFGIWKPILWIYSLPIGLFFWGFILSLKEYNKERGRNDKKDEIDRDTKWVTLGKMFYWFNGSEINSEEVQNIIEDEPSVKQFREYFTNIENEIKSKGKLILVFDNLDRLDNEKIKSLWSSIHTFFAEDNYNFESWVIIPYDKAKLEEHLENGYHGFISKTFSVNFRITPPVVTQWESFLNYNIDEAFGKKLISKDEKEYVIKLFDILSSHDTIKPRQIIYYVNNLVAMFKEWKDDIIKGNIKFRYISLFILTKDKILENANGAILNRSYLGNAEVLFDDDENLDTSMSMITFGVKKELADEILLDRQLKTALREGKVDIIESSLKHRAFQKYFLQANSSISLNEKFRGLVKIYEVIKNTFSKNMMDTFWKDFGKGLIHIEGQFTEFNDNHKAILKNTNKVINKNIINKIIRKLQENFNTNEVQEKYYSQLLIIEDFIKIEKIDLDIFSLIPKVEFNPDSFLNFINDVKNDYKKYKINCNEKECIDSFFNDSNVLDIDKTDVRIKELDILNNEFNLDRIIDAINTKINTVAYNDKVNFLKFINILKTLKKKPLNLKLAVAFYNQLSSARINEDEIYIDAYCIAISDFQNTHNNSSNFQNSLRGLTEDQINKISNKIEIFNTYGSLLKLIITNNTANGFPKLKDVIYNITINSYGASTLNLDWALKNFDNIATKVFANDEEKVKKFVEKLSTWHMYFETSPDLITEGFFKNLNRQELKLIELISKESLNYFKSLSKEEILEAFKTGNKNFKIFSELLQNDLIDKFSNAFYSTYDDYMKDIALEKETIPSDVGFWDELIESLNGNKLRSTYTSIRDIFINERGEVKESELHFFEKGLIKHGNLSSKPESSTLKIIIPLIESEDNFSIFLDNSDDLIEIINSSKEHKESAIGELQLKLNSDKYREDEKMLKISKILNLEVQDKESKEDKN